MWDLTQRSRTAIPGSTHRRGSGHRAIRRGSGGHRGIRRGSGNRG
ncbi:unnamed protein product, partial [Staurois parvus]